MELNAEEKQCLAEAAWSMVRHGVGRIPHITEVSGTVDEHFISMTLSDEEGVSRFKNYLAHSGDKSWAGTRFIVNGTPLSQLTPIG